MSGNTTYIRRKKCLNLFLCVVLNVKFYLNVVLVESIEHFNIGNDLVMFNIIPKCMSPSPSYFFYFIRMIYLFYFILYDLRVLRILKKSRTALSSYIQSHTLNFIMVFHLKELLGMAWLFQTISVSETSWRKAKKNFVYVEGEIL